MAGTNSRSTVWCGERLCGRITYIRRKNETQRSSGYENRRIIHTLSPHKYGPNPLNPVCESSIGCSPALLCAKLTILRAIVMVSRKRNGGKINASLGRGTMVTRNVCTVEPSLFGPRLMCDAVSANDRKWQDQDADCAALVKKVAQVSKLHKAHCAF